MPTAIVFSFGRGKLVCGGEGGAIAVADSTFYDALLLVTQHPIRAMQEALVDLPFEDVDSVAPHARIHPFAAALIAEGIPQIEKRLPTWRACAKTVHEMLRCADFQPVVPPAGAHSALRTVPVYTSDAERLAAFCAERGWTLRRSANRDLTKTRTVVAGSLLPALRSLGLRRRPARIRHTSTTYENTEDAVRRLWIVHP